MLTCYPQPNKGRSRDILRRFAAGCGGRVQFDPPAMLEDGPAAFFGVVGIEGLLNQARDAGREYYYLDNSYFDRTRKVMTRVGKNALQDDGSGRPDWLRYAALGLNVKPWTRSGRNVVVCMSSDHFMREVARWPGGAEGWLTEVTACLRQHTDRPIVVRRWLADKLLQGASFNVELENAWAVVTHMSAAANEAILAGVPAFVTGPCAASRMASDHLSTVESPLYPDGREEWAAALAGKQWSLSELSDGTAWRALCGMAG